jgi:hypothetical protein
MPNIERVFNLWKKKFCNKKYAQFMKINVTLLFKTTENKKKYESHHIITIKLMKEYKGQYSINRMKRLLLFSKSLSQYDL